MEAQAGQIGGESLGRTALDAAVQADRALRGLDAALDKAATLGWALDAFDPWHEPGLVNAFKSALESCGLEIVTMPDLEDGLRVYAELAKAAVHRNPETLSAVLKFSLALHERLLSREMDEWRAREGE